MKRAYLYRCVMLGLLSGAMSAQAQQADQAKESEVINLQPITIFGNKINGIDNTLPNVDVINFNTLRNPNVTNLKDAVSKNPAVEINSSASGASDQLRIRGFGKNYTELTLDGMKMPEYYVFGPLTSGSRDFVEMDTLRQLDIVKGLHSPKQSTGALAGTVNMQTYLPSDFVDSSNPFYGSIKAEYTGKNKGVGGTLTLGAAHNNLSGLLIYTHRKMHELDNMGSDATQSLRDEQNIRQQNILAKGEYAFESGNVYLTAEHFNRKVHTDGRYPDRRGNLRSSDEPTKRSRFAVKGELFNVAGLDKLDAQITSQSYSETSDVGFMNESKRKDLGFDINGEKTINSGDIDHNLLFGLGYKRSKFDDLVMFGPSELRLTPVVKKNTLHAYFKDQIVFTNGLTIEPGIRVEREKYDSTADAEYTMGNFAVSAQQGYVPNGKYTLVSPSLNISMPFGEHLTGFASYARGAKSPDTYNLSTFFHPRRNAPPFFIIPNPDLKPEKSDNFELGINYVVPDQVEFKLTGFYSKFKDFIAWEMDGSRFRGLEISRPYNINKREVYGAELEVGYNITPQWYAHGAVSWSNGIKDESSHGVTLNQSAPIKTVLGLAYNHADVWGGNVDWTIVGKAQKAEATKQNPNPFRAPGYGVVDVTAWWKPINNMTVTAGVYNLTDKKYWHGADVNGLASSPELDKYTQPGRNFAVNLRYDF